MLFFITSALADVELQSSAPIRAAQLSPPANLQAVPLDSKIVLSWTPHSNNSPKDNLGYVVFKSTSERGPWSVEGSILPLETHNLHDTEINPEVEYCYRVATIPQDTPTDNISVLWDTLLNYGSISGTVCATLPKAPSYRSVLFGLIVLIGGTALFVTMRQSSS